MACLTPVFETGIFAKSLAMARSRSRDDNTWPQAAASEAPNPKDSRTQWFSGKVGPPQLMVRGCPLRSSGLREQAVWFGVRRYLGFTSGRRLFALQARKDGTAKAVRIHSPREKRCTS